VPDSAAKGEFIFPSHGIQETPVKQRQEMMFDHSHPVLLGPGNDKENDRVERKKMLMAAPNQDTGRSEENIYKSLGWDEADDIDDLV
jgi:DNA replication regulator SLD3